MTTNRRMAAWTGIVYLTCAFSAWAGPVPSESVVFHSVAISQEQTREVLVLRGSIVSSAEVVKNVVQRNKPHEINLAVHAGLNWAGKSGMNNGFEARIPLTPDLLRVTYGDDSTSVWARDSALSTTPGGSLRADSGARAELEQRLARLGSLAAGPERRGEIQRTFALWGRIDPQEALRRVQTPGREPDRIHIRGYEREDLITAIYASYTLEQLESWRRHETASEYTQEALILAILHRLAARKDDTAADALIESIPHRQKAQLLRQRYLELKEKS